jgi:alanyl-tRNA synthetase
MSKKPKKSNNPIFAVGKTTEDKFVVDGIWKTYETHGLPLDTIFDVCIRKEWVPDWIALYLQMVASGMAHDRILSKLEEAINDSFGKEFGDVVISRLDQFFNSSKDTK